MTDSELAAIATRTQAATPAPWSMEQRPHEYFINGPENWGALAFTLADHLFGEEDATFIAHAPTDVAALLAEVERLRTREAALVAIAQDMAEEQPDWKIVNGLPEPFNKAWHCIACGVTREKGVPFIHAADCPRTLLRALLASDQPSH